MALRINLPSPSRGHALSMSEKGWSLDRPVQSSTAARAGGGARSRAAGTSALAPRPNSSQIAAQLYQHLNLSP